jgi:PKD repeat protein
MGLRPVNLSLMKWRVPMHMRKMIVLLLTILFLAGGLFLVDRNSQAVASPSTGLLGEVNAQDAADFCNVRGTYTNTFSFDAAAALASNPNGWKVDPILLERLQTDGQVTFYVILVEQADLSRVATLGSKDARTAYVFEQLTSVANKTQPPLLSYLDGQGVSYKSMYIQNMIRVEAAGLAEIEWLAARKDVAMIDAPPEAQPDPVWKSMTPEQRVEAIEWNIIRVKAPEVWSMGYHGEGYVVASNDTGVEYTHPALVGKYRGNLGGGNFDHNYNWWNGPGSTFPSDSDGHGTHTTGTMVGDDGAGNQIGVAPGAQWIACGGLYNVDPLECFEFFLAPWDLNGQNPDPSKSPDSINNSWYDPAGFDFRPIIQTLNAAGIVVVKSAGNAGPACSTITNPGYVPEIIATAAFGQGDVIASFSSRGPTSNYGETILKPEVAAPGDGIRSSVPGGGYEGGWSGTSMAAPHTTALVTLMWQAAPCIVGDVPTTKQIMMETAEAKIDAQCPPFVDHPNDVWGWGILDDQAAVFAAMAYCGGQGFLDGTVLENGSANPIESATITAERDDGYTRIATTDVTGYYTTTAAYGTYTVTADAFGYFPETVYNIEIITDAVTTQDFVLDLLPEYVISGTVSDAVSGEPLLAEISLLDTPLAPVMTDPGTGYYMITVPMGSYTLQAKADLHLTEQREVVVDGDLTEDFSLTPLPCILLVDDDQNNPDVRAYYTDALDQLGLDYFVWDTTMDGDPGAEDLLGYKIVIWFNGYPYSGTFTSTNEAAVAAYLDAGGSFLFSSQDYLYEYGLTSFGTGYLHIASYTSDVSQATVTGANPFAGLGPYTLSYPFTNYSDTVNPDAQAVVAFTGDQGNAAVAYDGETFKTAFLGYPFEAIPGLNDRADVLQAAVDYFGGCACTPVYGTSFTYDPPDPFTGEEVTFTGSASGSSPITYMWEFGDGNIGDGEEVTHVFEAAGYFTVTLSTFNACGEDSFSDVVMVAEAPDINLVPDAFDLTLVAGESESVDLLVENLGGFTLSFDMSESPEADWLSVVPSSGDVLPGESLTATLSFDASALEGGEYQTTLQVGSNDPDEPLVEVPVNLTVLDPPDIGASQDTFDVTLTTGLTTTEELLLSNSGDLALTFSITETPVVEWLAVDPEQGEILPDESLTVTLAIDATGLEPGEYNAALQLTSNDPDEPWISLPVELVVTDLPVEGLAAANDSPTPLGDVTTLSATITGGTNVVFTWDFGDGESGVGQVVTHTYAAPGVYTATVTAINPVSSLEVTTSVMVVPGVYHTFLPLVGKQGEPVAALAPSGVLTVTLYRFQ